MFIRLLKVKQYIPSIKVKWVDDPKPVGRWANHCDTSSNIRSALANLDSCGDRLCGDPLEARRAISYERKNDVARKALRSK